MNFKDFDLREQIDSLKGKWFFDDYKSKTRINKHSVVFNDDFKFELEYFKEKVQEETEDIIIKEDVYVEGFKEASKGDILHFEKGEILSDAFIRLSICGDTIDYYGWDKYSNNPNRILEDIMLYIANRI